MRHWGHIRWCVMGMIKCLVMFQDGAQAREVARKKTQVRVTLLGSTDLKSSLRARPEFVFVCFKGRSYHAKSEILSYSGSKVEDRFEGREVGNTLQTEESVRVW